MPSAIINFGLRGAQAVFGAIVLGLSVNLIKGHLFGTAPASLGFSAFVGAATLLGAAIGVAGSFVEILQGVIGLGIDALVLLFNLAGGVLLALKLKLANCSNTSDEYRRNRLVPIDLLNGGWEDSKEGRHWVNWIEGREHFLNSRCRESTADATFMFLTVVVLLVAGTLAFLRLKR